MEVAIQPGLRHFMPTGASPEFELLRACVRVALTLGRISGIRQGVERGVDWDVFMDRVAYHGVKSLVHHPLITTCPDVLPAEVKEEFEQAARTVRVRNRFLLEELERVLELLNTEGIPALPFKGPLLTAATYGHLRHRWSADLDLLVPASAFRDAAEQLQAAGYERHDPLSHSFRRRLKRWMHGQTTFTRGNMTFNLDVHTRVMPPLYAYHPGFQELWRRSTTVSVAGHTLPRLGALDSLLMLCHQGIKNRWNRLKYICDIAAVVEGDGSIDWDEALNFARRSKAHRALCLSVYLAHRVLESRLPPPVERALAPMEELKNIAARMARRLPRQPDVETITIPERMCFHWATQDTLGARVRYVTMATLRRVLDPLIR